MKITQDQKDMILAVLERWEQNAKEVASTVADQAKFGPLGIKGMSQLLMQMENDLYRMDGAKQILAILEINLRVTSDSAEEAISKL